MATDVSRRFIQLLSNGLVALWLAAPVPASAQAKDAFVEGLVDFSQASAGTFGDEGPAVKDALDKMSDGLARWDAAVARVETGFAGAITPAAPRQAAQMRATLGATYLERGRVADALPHLDAASSLEAAPPQILRGLGHAAREPASGGGRGVSAVRWRSIPAMSRAAMLFIDATRGAGPSKAARAGDGGAARRGLAYRRRRRRRRRRLPLLPLDLLDDASVDEPFFPPSAYARGVALLREAKHAEALASLRAAADADPLVTDAALATAGARAASTALRDQDAKSAVQVLLSVPGQETSSEIQRLLGVAYWTLEDYARSADHLRAAIRLNPGNERARIALSDVLVAARDPGAARDVLLQTIAAFPSSGQAQWRLGRLSQDAKRRGWRAPGLRGRVAPGAVCRRVAGLPGDRPPAAQQAGPGGRGPRLRAPRRPDTARARRPSRSRRRLSLAGPARRRAGRVPDCRADRPEERARVCRASARCTPTMATMQRALAMLQRAVALDATLLDARYAASRALLRLGREEEARAGTGGVRAAAARSDGGRAPPVRGQRQSDRRRAARRAQGDGR